MYVHVHVLLKVAQWHVHMTNHVHRALQKEKEKARKKERKGKEEKEAVNRKRQKDILTHNTHTSPTASNFHHA